MKYINDTGTTTYQDGDVPIIKFNNLSKLDFVDHAFSTRLGGVSTGEYFSMNLTHTRNDIPACVDRNFEIIAQRLGVSTSDMVYAKQTHTTNVLAVDKSRAGMGVTRERNFDNIDGLITNEPGVVLVTSYADCVPVFFADPVAHAIGLSHSGWRGTVGNISKSTIELMCSEYGCKRDNIICFIGPSICRDCYEIGEDVAKEFATVYSDDKVLTKSEITAGKYYLDLHRANYLNLINSGIPDKNIGITDICTCCNPDILYSHRASKGRRGGLCGFLWIK